MARFKFSGHETFPLRFGWLPKGLRELKNNPNIFFEKDAMVKLGVGKNMVRAIRHWCTTLNMAKIDGRKGIAEVTPLGESLFLNSGWDPYLEDPGTIWLLQWILSSKKRKASTWYLVFTKWNADIFKKDELIEWLSGIAESLDKCRATRNSIKRDVDVFLRTYIPSEPSPFRPIEDTYDSPLVELGLIKEVEHGLYRLIKGEKRSLPQAIFVYALIDFWNNIGEERATMSFETILYDPGSPARAFQLSESALANRLEKLPDNVGLKFDETSGLRNILRTKDALPDSMNILDSYYDHEYLRTEYA